MLDFLTTQTFYPKIDGRHLLFFSLVERKLC